MIEIFTFKTMNATSFHDQARLRKEVFIDQYHWQGVSQHEDMEFDEFDSPRAHYILVRDKYGKARGCCRLLPTTSPYMLDTLWPEFLGDEVPRSPKIYENSRYVVDHRLTGSDWKAIHALVSIGYMECLLDKGADQAIYFGSMSILGKGLENRRSLNFIPLGDVLKLDGEDHIAVITEPITQDYLQFAKRVHGESGPSIVQRLVA